MAVMRSVRRAPRALLVLLAALLVVAAALAPDLAVLTLAVDPVVVSASHAPFTHEWTAVHHDGIDLHSGRAPPGA